MTTVERSVLIHHAADRMRALVEDIRSYPLFLPWCGGAEIVDRGAMSVVAALTIDFQGIRQRLVTENSWTTPDCIRMKLVSGPFKSLDGTWEFKALDAGSAKITLRISYEFSSRLLQAAVGPVFRHITSTLVDAFVRRADALYGTRGHAIGLGG
jgi:ribosome-associated toxin RatA of RatAB toxin-antitoxin module